jgi:hypothetical protein
MYLSKAHYKKVSHSESFNKFNLHPISRFEAFVWSSSTTLYDTSITINMKHVNRLLRFVVHGIGKKN